MPISEADEFASPEFTGINLQAKRATVYEVIKNKLGHT